MDDIKNLLIYAEESCNFLLFGAVSKGESSLYKIRNEELRLPLNISDKNILLVGTLGAKTEDFKEALQLLKIPMFREATKKIIYQIVTKEEGIKIINNMVSGMKYFGKIIINFIN